MMPRTEHYGNQEFGPLTPPSEKSEEEVAYPNIGKLQNVAMIDRYETKSK